MRKQAILLALLACTLILMTSCAGDAPVATPPPEAQATQPVDHPTAPPEATQDPAVAEKLAQLHAQGRLDNIHGEYDPGVPLMFTPAALAGYDGKDGFPAYIAANGFVYDVSDAPQWKDGEHEDGYLAGTDISNQLSRADLEALLKGLPEIGILHQ